jgi:hypothetical protein
VWVCCLPSLPPQSMILLNTWLALPRPLEARMMSAAFFVLQTLLLACCIAVLANLLGAHTQYGLELQRAPPNGQFHHQECNVTFARAMVFLLPVEELELEEYTCLFESMLRGVLYQISCVLLTAALLLVFGVFLVMSMFVMDLVYFFGQAVADAGMAKE